MKVRNTFIIFLVSGFWHGANWTFVVWGALNALYFLPLLLLNKNRHNLETVAKDSVFPSLSEFTRMMFTFGLTTIAWIFFRAESVSHAWGILRQIFSDSLFSSIVLDTKGILILGIVVIFILIEWSGRNAQYALQNSALRWVLPLRWGMYAFLILLIVLFGGTEQQFIYFQF